MVNVGKYTIHGCYGNEGYRECACGFWHMRGALGPLAFHRYAFRSVVKMERRDVNDDSGNMTVA